MPHIHDNIDFTAEVFVVYKGRVLLRKHDKYKMWLSVGGHIEPDEDPNQAAVREVNPVRENSHGILNPCSLNGLHTRQAAGHSLTG